MLPSGLLSNTQNQASDKNINYQGLLTNIGSKQNDDVINIQRNNDDSFKKELDGYSNKRENRASSKFDDNEYEQKEVIRDPKRNDETSHTDKPTHTVDNDEYIKVNSEFNEEVITEVAADIKAELTASGELPEELESLEGIEFILGFLDYALQHTNSAPNLNGENFDVAVYLENVLQQFLPEETADNLTVMVNQLLTGEEGKKPLLDYIKQADLGGLKITPALKNIIDHYSGQEIKNVARNQNIQVANISSGATSIDDSDVVQSNIVAVPNNAKSADEAKTQTTTNNVISNTDKASNAVTQQQASSNQQQGQNNQQQNTNSQNVQQPTVAQQVSSEAENSVKTLIENAQSNVNNSAPATNVVGNAANKIVNNISSGAASGTTPTITVENAAAPVTTTQQVTYGADGSQKTVTLTKNHAAATEQIQVSVTKALNSGQNQMKVQLDPIELGKVDIRLNWSEGGKTSVHIIVEKPETFSMLQKDASSLEKALADSGFSMDQQNLQFSLKQGNQYSNKDDDDANAFGDLIDDLQEEEIEVATLNVRHNYADGDEAVDISI